ncbi:MAG TPA: MazG nucleotide pyrophosphohydrolase domain-containing protein [Dehalococcoidia bacterium]
MRDAQARVWAFQQRHGLGLQPELAALDLLAELGEVAKELLKRTGYGIHPPLPGGDADLREELGDLTYALLALANALEVDLDGALLQAMAKYEARILKSGDPGSRSP